MLHAVRAHDGASFTLTGGQLEAQGPIEYETIISTLSDLVSIPPDCLICMFKDGSQLKPTPECLSEIASSLSPSPDRPSESIGDGDSLGSGEDLGRISGLLGQRRKVGGEGDLVVYVFDRNVLEADPEEVEREVTLREEEMLEEVERDANEFEQAGSPVTSKSIQITPQKHQQNLSTSYLRHSLSLLSSIRLRKSALGAAISNLEIYAEDVAGGVGGVLSSPEIGGDDDEGDGEDGSGDEEGLEEGDESDDDDDDDDDDDEESHRRRRRRRKRRHTKGVGGDEKGGGEGSSTAFAMFTSLSSPKMSILSSLLSNYPSSMESVNRLRIHPALLSLPSFSSASGGLGLGGRGSPVTGGAAGGVGSWMGSAGSGGGSGAGGVGKERERERFLGQYISKEKMQGVLDGCQRVFNDLKSRFDTLRETFEGIRTETLKLREDFNETSLDDLDECEADVRRSHEEVRDVVRKLDSMTVDSSEMNDEVADLYEALRQHESDARGRIVFLVTRANATTHWVLESLQKISALQSSVAEAPQDLALLNQDLETKTDSFKHLTRLQGFVSAYSATLVEIVRRREFAQLLLTRSHAIMNAFSTLTELETRRRQVYRSEFGGKLPWKIVGMDEVVPSFEAEVRLGGGSGSGRDRSLAEELPDVGRSDIDALVKTLSDLDESIGLQSGGARGSGVPALVDARKTVERQVSRMDQMVRGLEKVMHKLGPENSEDAKSGETAALLERVRSLTEAKHALERDLQAERSSRETDIARLDVTNAELAAASSALKQDVEIKAREAQVLGLKLQETEREKVRAVRESEDAEERLRSVNNDYARAMDDLQKAESKSSSVQVRLEELTSELTYAQSQSQQAEVKLQDIERAHENLQTAYQTMETDYQHVRTAYTNLQNAVGEKEQLLRHHRSEADADRAVLENRAANLEEALEAERKEVEKLKEKLALSEAEKKGVQMELDKEKVARRAEVAAKEDAIRRADTESKQKEEASRESARKDEAHQATMTSLKVQHDEVDALKGKLVEALTCAKDLRNSNHRLLSSLAAETPLSSSKLIVPDPALANVELVPSSEPVDPNEIDTLLASLKSFDRGALGEAVRRKVDALATLTRKWQKECKVYRDRAQKSALAAGEKIAFRNFAVGDLGLFLPTRNSVAQVWAAFNVSAPHFFLKPTGTIAEQVKTREWIVARITSVLEQSVDPRDPDSNPFSLPLGTKYFLLEVEPWSSTARKRPESLRHASREGTSDLKRIPSGANISSPLSQAHSVFDAPTSSRKVPKADTLSMEIDPAASSSSLPSPIPPRSRPQSPPGSIGRSTPSGVARSLALAAAQSLDSGVPFPSKDDDQPKSSSASIKSSRSARDVTPAFLKSKSAAVTQTHLDSPPPIVARSPSTRSGSFTSSTHKRPVMPVMPGTSPLSKGVPTTSTTMDEGTGRGFSGMADYEDMHAFKQRFERNSDPSESSPFSNATIGRGGGKPRSPLLKDSAVLDSSPPSAAGIPVGSARDRRRSGGSTASGSSFAGPSSIPPGMGASQLLRRFTATLSKFDDASYTSPRSSPSPK